MSRAIIIANGELSDLSTARAIIRPDDLIIAADGGANYCRALGLTPQTLIGDLDSVLPAELAVLQALGVRVLKYPSHKDQTDLELALDHAIAQGANEIILLGALGGRWDQTLANLLLPALPRLKDIPIRLIDGNQQIVLMRGPGSMSLTGSPGDTVSLIPIGGDAQAVTTTGLEYPLDHDPLAFGSTLGVSNTLVGRDASVSLQKGLLVCVHISSMDKTD